MAQRTGLEPATPGVTGRYSNQLNYRCLGRFRIFSHFLKEVIVSKIWWVMTGSNCRHSACKADALPTELITLSYRSVGVYYIHLKLGVKPFLQKN